MMNMTLRQLTLFQAVAQHLSFTRAAIELSLTQPAVSIQIKQLEGHIGMPLFEQIGKRIFLTEAGHKLYAACEDIFERLGLLETSLNELQGSIKGQLKISVVTTATYFIPKIFQAFSRIYPEVNLRLEVHNRVKILERLTNNKDDLVVMGQAPEHLNVTAHSFLSNPLIVIASSQHQLANQSNISLSRLLQENILMREVGSGTRLAIEKNFATNNVEMLTKVELGSTEAIKQGVLANMGISMLSKHAVSLELSTKKMSVLDVETFPLKKNWYVTHLTEKKLSLVAKTFLDFLLTNAQNVVEQHTF
ncbi:LysR substrate-binding domain-containing protein [Candidatus Halobeggiatoa sp. HSG11]|nr:LysR substrate-binding domain-containing protein [Candidatus Halobeggiatoa sp. HSG11]